jgi:hypothetical protein
MGLFAALLCFWTRDAYRAWRSDKISGPARHLALVFLALVANYVVNGMFHDVSLIQMVNTLLFFLAGLTEGLWASTVVPGTQPGSETAVASDS